MAGGFERWVRLLAAVVLVGSAAGQALAQGAPPTRIRATIDSVDGDKLQMTSRAGEKVTAVLSPKANISGIVVTKMDDIKAGSFIGVTSVPQDDGTAKAVEVHVFPEAMRGAGEGHYPWDLAPKSSMTNGTVGSVVGTKGRTVTVEYKGGQTQIVIPDGIPVVTFEPGDKSLLIPGAHVMAFTTKAEDGTVTVVGISVGKNGAGAADVRWWNEFHPTVGWNYSTICRYAALSRAPTL